MNINLSSYLASNTSMPGDVHKIRFWDTFWYTFWHPFDNLFERLFLPFVLAVVAKVIVEPSNANEIMIYSLAFIIVYNLVTFFDSVMYLCKPKKRG